jgi:ATP-dependent helicase/nuclease subunit B
LRAAVALPLAPSQWASRLASFRALVSPLAAVSPETALISRSQAAALTAFETSLDEAARFLGDTRPIPLAEFWTVVQSVLRLSPLRIPDRRRNVVHVLSVFEARQWELPLVFVCGLTAQQFPKRRHEDPLFPDAARLSLAQSGVRVRTTAQLESEERFLFDLAATRATSRLTLSYPEADSRGVRNLPSGFLSRPVERCARVARPQPPVLTSDHGPPLTTIPQATFSPTGLECFLDCPFQFFARYTLKLRTRPNAPQDRLDFMLQGGIVHQTLAEWHKNPQPFEPLFERIFADACREKSVFLGYKTECLRRQMLEDLRQYCEADKLPAAAAILTEQPFDIQLADGLRLRGRIDRVDKLADGRAVVVDYKYSAAARVAARMTNESLLQAGLYALAVERELGLAPAAVFYFGLKKDLKVVGWSDPPGAFGIATQPLTPEWIASASARAQQAAAEIRSAQIAPDPATPDLCRLCDYPDLCRFAAQSGRPSEAGPPGPRLVPRPATMSSPHNPDPT